MRELCQRLKAAGERLAGLPPETPLPECMRRIGEEALRLLEGREAPAAILFCYDPERGGLDPASRVAVGKTGELTGPDWPRPDGMAAHALLHRRRVLSWEAPDIPIHPAKQAAGARSVGCWPLLTAEGPVGVLYLSCREERPFTEEEVEAIEAFTGLAALALQRHGPWNASDRRWVGPPANWRSCGAWTTSSAPGPTPRRCWRPSCGSPWS